MNKRLRFLLAGLAALFLTFTAHRASATHTIGTEITYSCISPGTYMVFLKMYRECSGAAFPNLVNLSLAAPGCNTGRSIPMYLTGVLQSGDPYCSIIPKGCTTTGSPNFERAVYSRTITFSAAEQACPDWVLSWSECCRGNVANLVNPGNLNVYAEARLKLLPGLNNNSPQFGDLSSIYVSYGQPTRFSSYATDSDGDSLVYSMQNPLSAINTPIAYGTYPTMVVYEPNGTKYAPLIGGSFSNAFPIITYTVDWSQPMPLYPVKNFVLNSRTGTMLFNPLKFVPNLAGYAPENKYAMVVQVDEYRKVNGVPVKIGTIRRDLFLAVVDPSGNELPYLRGFTANGQPVSENTIMNRRPGTTLDFRFASADSNGTDVLTLTTDANPALPGSLINQSLGNKPTATITWTPNASHIRDQVYYFHVTVKDDACPVKGFQTYTFGVKVSATGATGIPEIQPAGLTFMAFPNPFSQELNFRLDGQIKADKIIIYNILGRQVDQIAVPEPGSGQQTVSWRNAAKHAAGTYVARLVSAGKTIQTLKFTRLQ